MHYDKLELSKLGSGFMKKKILNYIFMFLILLPSMFLFSACGDKSDNDGSGGDNSGGTQEQGNVGLWYSDEWDWETETEVCYVSGIGTCTDKDIVIPATYNGKKVVGFNSNCFENANIDSLVCGENIKNLNYGTFKNSTIKSITLNNKIESISSEVFSGCINLTEINLPNSVKSIENNAFSGCTALQKITNGNGVETIFEWAFSGCVNLEIFECPTALKSIYKDAFDGCEKFEFLEEDGMKYWGNESNNYHTLIDFDSILSSVELKANVKAFNKNLFVGKENLKSLKVDPLVNYENLDIYSISSNLEHLEIQANALNYAYFDHLKTLVINGGDTLKYLPSSQETLEEVTICSSIKTIEVNDFDDYLQLATVKYEGKIDDWAVISFINQKSNPLSCEGVSLYLNEELFSELNFTNNLTEIKPYTFMNLTSLTAIDFSELTNLTKIGSNAFSGCSNINSVILPESLTNIDSTAFSGNSITYAKVPMVAVGAIKNANLGQVEIINGTEVPQDAFNDLTNLTKVILAESVTKLGMRSFYGCTSLNDLNYGNITAFGDWCLARTAFTTFSFSSKVTDFGQYIIGPSLTEVNFDLSLADFIEKSNTAGDSILNYDYTYLTQPKLKLFGELVENLHIPNGVTKIGNSVFSGYGSIKTITMADSVTEVGYRAFSGMKSLTTVTLGKNVKKVNESFNNCTALTYIDFGESLEDLSYRASDCLRGANSIETIIIPTTVDDDAAGLINGAYGYVKNLTIPFKLLENIATYKIAQLESITFNDTSSEGIVFTNEDAQRMPKLKSFTMSYGAIGDAAFYIEQSVLETVKFGANVTFEEEADQIFYFCKKLISADLDDVVLYSLPNDIFAGCSKLENVKLPNMLTTIEGSAFDNCESLVDFDIPETVETLGDSVFNGCGSITSFTLKKQFKNLGMYLFSSCENMTEFTFEEGFELESLPKAFFNDCSKLERINNFPSMCTEIGDEAFAECYLLDDFDMRNLQIETLGKQVFYECESLGKTNGLMLPKSLKSIGEEAFYGCDAFTNVYYTGTDDEWCCIKFEADLLEDTEGMVYSNPISFANVKLFVDNQQTTHVTEVVLDNVSSSLSAYSFFKYSYITKLTVNSIDPQHIGGLGLRNLQFAYCPTLTEIYLCEGVGYSSYRDDNFVASHEGRYYRGTFGGSGIIKATVGWVPNVNEGVLSKTLKELTVLGGTIANKALTYTSLEKLTLKKDVTSVGNEVFHSVKDIIIEEGSNLEFIGTDAFGAYIESINLENATKLKTISDEAFVFAYASTITIPASVETIGKKAFYKCQFKTIIFESGSKVKVIAEQAFAEVPCSEITIPEGVETIETKAFYRTTSLLDTRIIHIPSTVTTIKENAFAIGEKDISGLTKEVIINFAGSMSDWAKINRHKAIFNLSLTNTARDIYFNNSFKSENPVLETEIKLDSTATTVTSFAFYAFDQFTSLSLGNALTTIATSAFVEMENITGEVVIPASVETIGISAFQGTGITSVVFEEGSKVTIIEAYTFGYCANLTTIELVEGLVQIEDSCFRETALTQIVLPTSFTTINDSAFFETNDFKYCVLLGDEVEEVVYFQYAYEFVAYCYYGDAADCKYTGADFAFYSEVDPTTREDYSEESMYWKYDESGSVVIWET